MALDLIEKVCNGVNKVANSAFVRTTAKCVCPARRNMNMPIIGKNFIDIFNFYGGKSSPIIILTGANKEFVHVHIYTNTHTISRAAGSRETSQVDRR